MKTRIIARHDVGGVIAEVGLDTLMDEMIENITSAIRGFDEARTIVRVRDGFHYTEPDVGLLEWMPVMNTAETTTIKIVGYHPNNPSRRNLPTILSTISVYDTETGHLAGLADGTFLTAMRTGAASAIASKVLARPDSRVLGMIGCGAQAVTQLHALVRTYPLDTVLFHDTNPLAAATFPDRVARIMPDGMEAVKTSITGLLKDADIVCTSTSVGLGAGPLFSDPDTKPWLHINAVGADFPGKFELPVDLLKRSSVCPDNIEQAMKEGECQQLDRHEIGPTLSELVADPSAFTHEQDRITVFDSTGWALLDQVAVRILLAHADRLDLGIFVELEDVSDDPLNPYDFHPAPNRHATVRSAPADARGE